MNQINPDCKDCTIQLAILKKDMEMCKEFNNDVEDKLDRIATSLRILEDKSIVHSLMEKGVWFVVGIAATVIVQNYVTAIAIREENKYKIEKRK